jgi:predicted aspartyl protease
MSDLFYEWLRKMNLSAFVMALSFIAGWLNSPGIGDFVTCHFLATAFADDNESPQQNEVERFYREPFGAICVPVQIWGETELFILDTGASVTVLDKKFEPQLDEVIKKGIAITASSEKRVTVFSNPEILIGKNLLKLAEATSRTLCMDFSQIQAVTGSEYVGIIGMDFLASRVLRINFDEDYAALLRNPTNQTRHEERIRYGRRGTPAILLEVTGDGFHSFMIDTGKFGIATLKSELFKKLEMLGKISIEEKGKAIGFSGEFEARFGILEELKLGPYRLRNLRISEGHQNLIGLRFLEYFDTELDFPNQRAKFRPGKKFGFPQPRNLTGFGVKRVENRTFTWDLESSAESAGIREGDEILRLNGTLAVEFSIPKIHGLFSEPDTDLILTLERDGKSFDITLNLKRKEDPFPATANVLEEDVGFDE